MKIKPLIHVVLLSLMLLALWQSAVFFFDIPRYMLPPPNDVLAQLHNRYDLLWQHSQITLLEIGLGLFLGVSLGLISALLLSASDYLSKLLLPLLVISQAIPVFAIAPLLVLWFGYGLASKIVMTILIIYFPVTAACYDGLRNTSMQWLELAKTMQVSASAMLFKVRLPAALPSFASGLRIAVSVAPIGAIVGEWVGSSQGLGYLMLHTNARMQVDLMFSALLILMVISLVLYFSVDYFLRKWLPWVQYIK
ncbi:ABC transporter permease [Pasteurella multocida]|uniref:ABC transporter permease n=1 Tax=Pasteurella multocida TaxID=747 RepID=UPI0021BE5078|nr:ABC transporter permease [Pasteurella multocida]MCT8984815.1 ABC transporter permease [Pasteurella multocida]